MNRFQAPTNTSGLSYRDRSANNAAASTSSSTYVPTPPLSGRSTPFQSNSSSYPYGGGNGLASNSTSSLQSFGMNGGVKEHLAPSPSSRFHDHRSAEQLESQNDEMIDGIGAKVQQLRANDAFSETGDILGGTFRRMNAMAKRQGSRWMCYMLFIILVIWFFIFVWWFR